MDNIQFTFKHDSNTNFLEIIGTKIFNNKNFTCSVWDKIDKIDLQEMLSKITMSIQDKIIEDLSNQNKEISPFMNINSPYVLTRTKGEGWSNKGIKANELYIKFEEEK